MEKIEDTFNDEINLLDYVRVILKHKRLILWITVIAVVLTAFISLIVTPIYEAKAVILPIAQGVGTSATSAIASQFGISAPEQSNTSEVVGLLKSNILRERVLKRYNLLPVLFEEKSLKDKTEDEKIWMGLRYLEEALKINFNQKEGTVSISMEFEDPKIAADIVNYILKELNDYMSSEIRRVAETNRRYLESQIDKTADPFIKTNIYSLIAKQIETSAMAEAKENFAFKVIDPPKAPDKRSKPKRKLMVVVSFVVSLFFGIFLAFFKEYIDKHQADIEGLGINYNTMKRYLDKINIFRRYKRVKGRP
ncbi:MAG TPA: hypothetical protein DDW17_02575 [Deltaproteobacteria bacterium]|nr:hypothetical protein [Deltaproteobacteria bacterium]